ncbi:MAG TPA: alcohol dehydrogenase catalytic domain-containing protein [Planctomycetota bacterium]|nr:alcohol dehydrogenase catalytic domain-containing protein [Planctomycetota bacterium]
MIPPEMKAAVYRGRGKVEVERVPVPPIGPGEVLVRIAACGVCHTDLKKVEYGLQPPPRIYGHEMAGVIAAMGKGVRGWKIGDRVAVFHHIPCGNCFYCERGDYAQCPVYKKTGSTAGFEPAGGGFAEYIRVLPWIVQNGMVRVPKSVPLEYASFLEPVNTCLKGVDRLNLRKGDLALVFGQGPIGLLFTQLLKARGATPIGLDLIASRRRLSTKLGAAWSADPRAPGFEKRLRKESDGRGADAAVLAVPSEAALKQALSLLRPGGTVLLFAHTRKGEEVRVDAGAVCVDEKTVLGSYSSSIDVADEVARLVFSRRVDVGPLISHRFPLEKVTEAFELAAHPTPTSLKILVTP